jgi:hypothetical protein
VLKRVVIVAALASLSGSLNADGPFGRRGAFGIFSRRTAPQQELGNQDAVSPYRHLMNSPEKLTELFGPSILVREQPLAENQTRPANKVSRFVTQPSD